MAIDPAVLQGAYVATDDPAGALPGIPVRLNAPVFVKAIFEAGRSYTIGTNLALGDLVLLGPSGNPIGPGTGLRGFTFTPLTSGVHLIELVPDPRIAANRQPVSVTLTEQDVGLPTDLQGAFASGFGSSVGSVRIAGGGGGQRQFFLHPPGTPLPAIGDDIAFGNDQPNRIATGAGNDQLYGGLGDDTLLGGTGNDHMDGGGGTDIALFSGSLSQYQFGRAGTRLFVAGPDGLDDLLDVERLQFGASVSIAAGTLLNQATTFTMVFQVSDTRTGRSSDLAATPYAGSVGHRSLQYLGQPTGEVVNGTAFNDFINALGGDDAVHAGAGDDVVDGGTGSNFLGGGAGRDVFFLDGRGGGTTWSTITDWQAGEQLSVWGWRPGVSRATWAEGAGAAGFGGVTLHGDLNGDGVTDVSVTWSGMTRAQLPVPREFDGLLWVA